MSSSSRASVVKTGESAHEENLRARTAGAIIARYAYDAYGNRTLVAGTDVTKIGFTGLRYNAVLNLWEAELRWYDPRTGQWIKEDPIGFAGGYTDFDQYLGNDPVNKVDPSGLAEEPLPPFIRYRIDEDGVFHDNPFAVSDWNSFAEQRRSAEYLKELHEQRRQAEWQQAMRLADWVAQAGVELAKQRKIREQAERQRRDEQWLDDFQDKLGYGGFIPCAGAVPDGINALIYALRGKWGEALSSAASAVPALGEGYAATRKGGKLVSNALEEGAEAARKHVPGNKAVIGKMDDITPDKLRPGENTLLQHMTDDLRRPKLNWGQNSRVLRTEMGKGLPIRDASVNQAGELINNTGFLRAERELLRNHNWTYNPGTQLWSPPK